MKFTLLLLAYCITGKVNFTTGITLTVLYNNLTFNTTADTKNIKSRTLVNRSLTELIRFHDNHRNNSDGVVSFLNQPFNFVLGEYFKARNYQEFHVDHPITTELVETIYQQHPQRLFILSYDNCQDPIVIDLLASLGRFEIKSVCRLYDPFGQKKTPLSMLLNSKDLSDYTHLLLFLSPYDVDLVKEYLASMVTGKKYQLYVSLSPVQRGYPTLQRTPPRVNVNVSKASKQDDGADDDDVTTACTKIHHLDQKVISKDLENLFNNKTNHDRVSDSIRRQLRNQSCDFHSKLLQSHRKKEEKYIRVTGSIYYPYNVLLNLMPTSYGECILAGHLCYLAAANTNANGSRYDNITWIPRCCDGIALSLLRLVAEKLNFKYDVYLTPDNKFGGRTEDGEWVGMIGDLVNGRADLAANGFNPTMARMKVIRFTPAFFHDHPVVVLRRSSLEEIPFVNWEFVRTMETDLAFLVLVSTLCTALFLVGAENVGFLMRRHKYFSTREVMTYIFGLTFQRDMGGKNPLRWAARIAALSYAAAMMIVMTTYTAYLTAKNIQSETISDFYGFNDQKILNPTSAFKASVMDATSFADMFKYQPKYQNFWKFTRNYPVSSNTDGIEKVLSGHLDGYISDSVGVQTLITQSKYCQHMQMYVESSTQVEVSFVYRKDLRLGELISQTILRINEREEMSNVFKKWIYLPHCLSNTVAFSQFDVNYFGGILFIVGILCIVSVFLIVLENFYTYVRMKRVHKHEDKYRSRTLTTTTNLSLSNNELSNCD